MQLKVPNLKFNNPIGEEKLEEVINLLKINSSDKIVDIGGGNGELLLKMIGKTKATGVLIELNKDLIEICQKKSPSLIDNAQLILVEQDASIYVKTLALESIDCFVCVGASYIFGSYVNLIKAIFPYLKKGGFLLVGEEFWTSQPSEEYLKILGGKESESRFHYENIAVAEELEMTYLYSVVASEDDWNRFEGVYFLEETLKAKQLVATERQERLKKIKAFRQGQFRYGRSTMCFGLYLFAKEI